MEIKKGDKIRLKSNINDTHYIKQYIIEKFSNKILTVSEVYTDCLNILEDGGEYFWFFDMFDKINDESYVKEIKTKNKIKSIVVEIKIF